MLLVAEWSLKTAAARCLRGHNRVLRGTPSSARGKHSRSRPVPYGAALGLLDQNAYRKPTCKSISVTDLFCRGAFSFPSCAVTPRELAPVGIGRCPVSVSRLRYRALAELGRNGHVQATGKIVCELLQCIMESLRVCLPLGFYKHTLSWFEGKVYLQTVHMATILNKLWISKCYAEEESWHGWKLIVYPENQGANCCICCHTVSTRRL